MHKYVVLLVLIAQLILCSQAYEKPSFFDVEVKVSKYVTLDQNTNDSNLEDKFTGNFTGDLDEFKYALEISITSQEVESLDAGAFQRLRWLHSIKLQNNRILTVRAGAFVDLPVLSLLDLSHNKIEELAQGIFSGLKVTRLFLNDNKISVIDSKAFDNMPNLKRIQLDGNDLREWNSHWFVDSPNIYYLSVARNNILELPVRAFTNIRGKHISLDKGGMRYIFTSLRLDDNAIATINPTAFEGLKELECLNLSGNAMENIEEGTFAHFKKINNLFLNKNNIGCVSEKILSELPKTDLIDLSDITVGCECMNEMKIWSSAHFVNLKVSSKKYRCL